MLVDLAHRRAGTGRRSLCTRSISGGCQWQAKKDRGMSMEWPGEKLIIRLFETVERGIGEYLKPWQIRRVGSATTDAMKERVLLLAEAEQEAARIRGRTKTGSGFGDPQSGSVAETLTHERTAREIEKEVNVGKAVLFAEEELKDSAEKVPQQRVESDWVTRWRESAGTVSVEQLQQLWGRLLAGEIKSPGTFSLRTLEFVRNLSTEEAERISHLSTFVVSDAWIPYITLEQLASEGITTGYLLEMAELGVINPASLGISPLEQNFTSQDPRKHTTHLWSHNKCLLISHEDTTKAFTLPAVMLTTVGRQVMRLGSFKTNQRYLEKIGLHIAGKGFEVSIADFVRQPTAPGVAGRWHRAQPLNRAGVENLEGIARVEIRIDGLSGNESARFTVDTFTGYKYTQEIHNATPLVVTIPATLIGRFVAVVLHENTKWGRARVEFPSFCDGEESVVTSTRKDGGIVTMRARSRIDVGGK